MGEMRREDSSFRDPSGFLFYRDNVLYRQVNSGYKEDYDFFLECGLYEALVEDGLLIPHEEVDIGFAYVSTTYFC